MKFSLQQARIQQLINKRNGYLTLSASSMLVNILLVFVIFMLIGHERIVIVPPVIEKSFWVSENRVSADYLSQMGLFFANIRLNTTPSNASYQRELLLRYTNPVQYGELKSELLNEEEHLKKEHMTMAFSPIVPPTVDSKRLIVRIVGDMKISIGEMHLPSERKIYDIAFQCMDGRLFVKSFSEVKGHV